MEEFGDSPDFGEIWDGESPLLADVELDGIFRELGAKSGRMVLNFEIAWCDSDEILDKAEQNVIDTIENCEFADRSPVKVTVIPRTDSHLSPTITLKFKIEVKKVVRISFSDDQLLTAFAEMNRNGSAELSLSFEDFSDDDEQELMKRLVDEIKNCRFAKNYSIEVRGNMELELKIAPKVMYTFRCTIVPALEI